MSLLDPKIKGSIQVGRGNGFGALPVGVNGQVIVADSTEPSGVKWITPSAIPGVGSGLAGLWMYGDGSDGNLTLVANTTLAVGDSVKNYDTLTLAGFELTFDTTDPYMVLYVKTTLSGGGGRLSAQSRGPVTATGGLGGTAGGTGGAGGDGGNAAGAIYLFAKTISTSVTVDASGTNGTSGADGTLFVAGDGADGNAPAFADIVFVSYLNTIGAGQVFGLASGLAGIAGILQAANRVVIARTYKDILRLMMQSGISQYSVVQPPDLRLTYSGAADGGGGASAKSGATVALGGGGAGGAPGIVGDGGAGGDAAVVATGIGNKASGGGGGSGAGGGLIHLICDDILAAITVTVNGGNGGNGGTGAVTAAGVARGGGGAGGGGGGIAVVIVNTGSGFVTVTATGGTAGAGGANVGAAGTGVAGTAGVVGYTALLLKS